MQAIPPELLARLSRPGPRYTSYPTANVFDERTGPAEQAAALARTGASGRPISLYVHLPFCRSLCHYCACNVVVSQKRGIASSYLDALELEVGLVSAALGARPHVSQLHLGGGTPTFLDCAELRRLHGILAAAFDLELEPGDERAVEVDPRVTTREQLATLAALGWNRASFGVQDMDPDVQLAINRLQPRELTAAVVAHARELGFQGINVDLVYGLPFQTPLTFARTLEAVLELRPDRVALYSYAHVPWMRPAQRRFDTKGYPLPGPEEKFALFRLAVERLEGAGYDHLGMDHFALPSDELARARAAGTLHRNFQGYTVRRADDLIGLGVTSISDHSGVYAQNQKDLTAWEQALGAGRLPTERGWQLSAEDLRRREAIMALMTGAPLPAGFAADYAEELAGMDDLEQDGLVRRSAEGLEVTALGRFFIRNVAMRFDRYLGTGVGAPTFSRTV
ncbi:MAG: oxygen-independent coproporphyrinogen III oxidase [Planctomycetota bacterium]